MVHHQTRGSATCRASHRPGWEVCEKEREKLPLYHLYLTGRVGKCVRRREGNSPCTTCILDISCGHCVMPSSSKRSAPPGPRPHAPRGAWRSPWASRRPPRASCTSPWFRSARRDEAGRGLRDLFKHLHSPASPLPRLNKSIPPTPGVGLKNTTQASRLHHLRGARAAAARRRRAHTRTGTCSATSIPSSRSSGSGRRRREK